MKKKLYKEIVQGFIDNKGFTSKKLDKFEDKLVEKYKIKRYIVCRIIRDVDDWYANQSEKWYFLG